MANLTYESAVQLLESIAATPPPSIEFMEKAKVAAITCKRAKEFADFLNIDIYVFKHWCKNYPRFKKIVDSWKDYTDDEVEIALAKKAIGFKKTTKRDVLTKAGTVETLYIESYYPPDTAAAQFWLKNRKKDEWQDKTEVDVNVNANIRAWLIAAGEEVPEAIEGQHKFVGISEEGSAPLNITEVTALNTIEVAPLNNASEQHSPMIEQEVKANDPSWSLFDDE